MPPAPIFAVISYGPRRVPVESKQVDYRRAGSWQLLPAARCPLPELAVCCQLRGVAPAMPARLWSPAAGDNCVGRVPVR